MQRILILQKGNMVPCAFIIISINAMMRFVNNILNYTSSPIAKISFTLIAVMLRITYSVNFNKAKINNADRSFVPDILDKCNYLK